MDDVVSTVRDCVHITQVKRPKIAQKAPMAHIIAHRPLELVCLDFLKLDRAEYGYEDVLVCTDAFSRFAIAIPCPDQTAATTAARFRDNFICLYGVPERIHSDQGRNFESAVVNELCRLFGIQKSHTTTYHPQGNSITERFNRSLIQLLLSFQHSMRKHWPSLLRRVCFIYNSTPQASTGMAPFTLMFGREQRIPKFTDVNPHTWSTSVIQDEHKRWQEVTQLAEKNAAANRARNKRIWDGRVKAPRITPGMVVFRQVTGHTERHKLADFHRAERYVVEIVSDDGTGCVIRPIEGGRSERVHRDKVVPVPGEIVQAEEKVTDSDSSDEEVVVEVQVPVRKPVKAGEEQRPPALVPTQGVRRSARESKGVPPERYVS